MFFFLFNVVMRLDPTAVNTGEIERTVEEYF